MNSHVNILILNWNGSKVLKPCLDSIMNIEYNNFSTTVIDNASTDDSCEMLKSYYPKVELLKLGKNFGYSKAYNKCFKIIENTNPEFLLL